MAIKTLSQSEVMSMCDKLSRVAMILEAIPNIVDDLENLHLICVDMLGEVRDAFDLFGGDYELGD